MFFAGKFNKFLLNGLCTALAMAIVHQAAYSSGLCSCQKGYYVKDTNPCTCQPCPQDKYSPIGQTCEKCPGDTTTNGQTGQSSCLCPKNHYYDATAGKCTACPLGGITADANYNIIQCHIPQNKNITDSTGTYHFETDCRASSKPNN